MNFFFRGALEFWHMDDDCALFVVNGFRKWHEGRFWMVNELIIIKKMYNERRNKIEWQNTSGKIDVVFCMVLAFQAPCRRLRRAKLVSNWFLCFWNQKTMHYFTATLPHDWHFINIFQLPQLLFLFSFKNIKYIMLY